jgi:hypothetical protein
MVKVYLKPYAYLVNKTKGSITSILGNFLGRSLYVHPTAHEGLVHAGTAGSTTSRRGEVPSSRGQDRDFSVHWQAKKIAVNLCFQSNYSNPSSSILLVSMTPSVPSANSSLSYGINADPSQLFLYCQRCILVPRQLLQCLATSVKQGVVLSARGTATPATLHCPMEFTIT